MKNSFFNYHPIVNFCFYCLVLGITLFFMHPILMFLSALGALGYAIYLKGRKVLLVVFGLSLPTVLLSAIINPLFSHQGVTILFYNRVGNPITLESIVYGIVTGIMLAIVILWFTSFNVIMTSDKFVYLFGKVLPATGLLLAMIFRFMPRFNHQLKKVIASQKCIGKSIFNGNIKQRLSSGVKIMSIMVTWSLENSIETANSMKSRGYGLRGRTSFHLYSFDKRDKFISFFMLLVFLWLVIGISMQKLTVFYYPMFNLNSLSWYSLIAYGLYGILCFLPILINVWEDIKWHYLQSKI